MAELKLKPNTVAKIQKVLESGRYQDADEVVLTALDSLEDEERHNDWLWNETQKGLEQLERGESVLVTDLDEFFKMIKARAAERDAAGIPIKDAVKP